MKPLICFYENEKFIFSENYERLICSQKESVPLFLSRVEKPFSQKLKVVQINFEAEHENLFFTQETLYSTAKAHIYVLESYDLLSLAEVLSRLNPKAVQDLTFKSLVDRDDFIEKTKSIQSEIRKGRIYQANLTAPLIADCHQLSEDLFCEFQKTFTGAYKAHLPAAEFELLSFSPELFLRQRNGTLLTRPIKGSMAEGRDFEKDLLANQKEEAELSMIVDLLRNDLNSLSPDESAVVTKHREKMALGYIQHTYSEISIASRKPLSEVVRNTFPGGSISGCPKLEALKVLSEIEEFKRQAYTGCLGWWKENEFTLSLTIRSFIKTNDRLFYHAGCGIVYDSNPEAEWQEFLLKTGTLNVR